MEHRFEIKGGDLIVTVKNSKEELQKYYHSALVACCNEVTIRGFRKGQAPLDVASRAVNPEMLNDRFTERSLTNPLSHISKMMQSSLPSEKIL